uniref:Uncharacterized protein n=1 Tax=Arundo donax TaxID=35708 RepID=A0A0A9DAG9_ARUDO
MVTGPPCSRPCVHGHWPTGHLRPPAAGALVSLADGDVATADLLAVHALDCVVHRLLVIELHEPVATRPPCLPVHHDLAADRAVGGEGVLEGALAGGIGEVAHMAAVLRPGAVLPVRVPPWRRHLPFL